MEEGRMSVDSDEGEMIINEVDGLPNMHPNYEELELSREASQRHEARTIEELINDEDLPTSLIVTNLDISLFKSDELKVTYITQKYYIKQIHLTYINNVIFKI